MTKNKDSKTNGHTEKKEEKKNNLEERVEDSNDLLLKEGKEISEKLVPYDPTVGEVLEEMSKIGAQGGSLFLHQSLKAPYVTLAVTTSLRKKENQTYPELNGSLVKLAGYYLGRYVGGPVILLAGVYASWRYDLPEMGIIPLVSNMISAMYERTRKGIRIKKQLENLKSVEKGED